MTRREALAVALVAAYSIVLNTVVPLWAHVPAGLAAATGLALLARADGASTADLGLRRSDAAGGLRLGALVAVPVAVALAAALALPATRRLLASNPAADAGTARFLYEVCVRIPFGTALVEELVFRGALLAMILRRHGTKTAVAATSALFGLWHVLPTLASLHPDAGGHLTGGGTGGTVVTVAVTVAVTGLAGAGFAWLRLRSGSLLAPVLVHTALNALALSAGRIASSPR